MGCWIETCAVTNLPIYEGDEVIMILPEPGEYIEIPDPEKLVTKLYWQPSDWYDSNVATNFKRIQMIERGRYDEYGWLINTPSFDDGASHRSIFILAEVWDKIQAIEFDKCPLEFSDLQREIYEIKIDQNACRELCKFIWFCSSCRLLLDRVYKFKGSQSFHKSNFERLIAMTADLQNKIDGRWDDQFWI